MPIIIRHEPVDLLGSLAGRAAQSSANEQALASVQDISRMGLAAQAGVNDRTDRMVGLMGREQDRQALEQYRQQQIADREAERQADFQRAILQQQGFDARSQAQTDRMMQGIFLRDELARRRDAEEADAGASVYPGVPLAPQSGAVAPRRRAIGGAGAAVTPDAPDAGADPKDANALLTAADKLEKSDPYAARMLRFKASQKMGIAPPTVRAPTDAVAGNPQDAKSALDQLNKQKQQSLARLRAFRSMAIAASNSFDPGDKADAAVYREMAAEELQRFRSLDATGDPITSASQAETPVTTRTVTPTTTSTPTSSPSQGEIAGMPAPLLTPQEQAMFSQNRDAPTPAPVTLNRVETLPDGTVVYFDERTGMYVEAPQGARR